MDRIGLMNQRLSGAVKELNSVEVPRRVNRAEVEALVRRFGADADGVRQQLAELKVWEDYLAENQRENDRIRDAREAKLTEERAARDEADRQAQADKRAAELRTRFFRANPHANEADFDRLKQRLMDEEMLDNARGGKDDLMDEMRALRGSGDYRM